MNLEQKSIERIKIASEMSLHHYGQPLVCTYSGGKDSDVMLELFKRSGVPFEVHNSHTTVDAPQTVYHIRKKFRQLELQGIKADIEMPTYKGKPVTMWQLIPIKKMPPTRLMRYCCSVLKETGCANRFIATGVRWDESRAPEKEGTMNNQIENNFNYHAPKEGQTEKYAAIREKAKELAYLIDAECPSSREKSLAMTKLEETVMWANTSIARN